MNYWMVKSEPNSYSWEDFEKAGEDVWDGVRNYQARNYLKAMEVGDLVMFYHSGKEKAVVGIAQVTAAAFADPKDEAWMAVNLRVAEKLANPVTLTQIKAEDQLADLPMLKQSRLSVLPMSKGEFDWIKKMAQ